MKRIFFALFCFMAMNAEAAQPVAFSIAPESTIVFEFTREGKARHGELKDFTGTIAFHPDALGASKAAITIPLTGITTDDKEANGELQKSDWLNIAAFPSATFETTSFKHIADKRYEALGTLTLKGVSLPLTLAFTLDSFSDKEAAITGETTLKRKDFKIGWPATDMVADEVKITVKVRAIGK